MRPCRNPSQPMSAKQCSPSPRCLSVTLSKARAKSSPNGSPSPTNLKPSPVSNSPNGRTKKKNTGRNPETVGHEPPTQKSSPRSHLAVLFDPITFARLGDVTRLGPRAGMSVAWACGTSSRAAVSKDSGSKLGDVASLNEAESVNAVRICRSRRLDPACRGCRNLLFFYTLGGG